MAQSTNPYTLRLQVKAPDFAALRAPLIFQLGVDMAWKTQANLDEGQKVCVS